MIYLAIAARAALCGMRLRAHHPRQYADGGASLPQSEKDMLFDLSLQIMQYDSLAHASKGLQGYLWHVIVFFQWHALIYLLSELRFREIGEQSNKAWDQIEDTFRHHPEIISDRDYALYSAIRSLALKGWEDREMKLRQLRIPLHTPDFITNLRTTKNELAGRTGQLQFGPDSMCMAIASETDAMQQRALPYNISWTATQPDNHEHTAKDRRAPMSDLTRISESTAAASEPLPVDWEQWDAMIHSMDLPVVDLDAFFQ
jgi:hypothetical protein